MTSSTTDRSVREYERDADLTRQRLASTLDELVSSVTPGRMLDEVLTYARGGGASFLKGLGNSASANPIPTLLIGVGAAMFLTGEGKLGLSGTSDGDGSDMRAKHVLSNTASRMGETHPTERRLNGTGASPVDMARSAASAVRESAVAIETAAEDAARSALSGVRDGTAAIGATVSEATDAIGSAATTVAEKAREGLAAAGDTLGGLADEAADSVTRTGEQFRGTATRLAHDLRAQTMLLVREQPLVVAAAGLALGAAIAALLPKTKLEDSVLGGTSDSIKEAVGEVAAEQYERAASAVGRVVEEVKTTAVQEGLTSAAAVGAVRDLGEKLTSVVAAGGEAAKEKSSATSG
jgi:hypothetical protein